ncbi:hypothetical protein LOZ12_002623 [Ophidiomyces ophidiicola]|uniref:Uncharacterized protein n=1 Tax=Ophidiomyces ophidiicola TaxID=1387563 RepID=A0ACB8V2H1_9EURO|nr:uncharacterized protein LOZ57_005284 [Ophidiomyces ophidiicola]KAI1918169.1 hypothetical protein LOZ64_002910 [Ophidiomyces ophidiicola]KAI1942987.1 hypothetical protein LOZ57_005284 [Ophidiomyces ophidiicola]KAI1954655.1 hypothetical protein LOZ62_000670 [Ophidiomyces ophidiicola]KAI1958533.1 hypothetical protein LOZ59_003465 [Ophidiomyces ophidiicola]KAI2000571.1 hypothetical protein LOZ50_005837 [Ophidiomyces ophidiicola]
MAASPSVLSQTLQAITTTKIDELEKQRQTYEKTKAKILVSACDSHGSIQERISRLHDGVKELELLPPGQLENISRWVEQSRYDPTVPESMLIDFETELRSRLDRQTRKLDLADLYSRLLIEWINTSSPAEHGSELGEAIDDDFDVVENIQKERLQQLRERFEKVVFEPLVTDEKKITQYLESLFDGDDGEKVLSNMRSAIKDHGEMLFSEKRPVGRTELKSCIQSLLKNDLLNDQKLASLGEFLHDDTVLDEIANVLNMRYTNLSNWSWNLGGKGMPVLPRQSLNGKWRVMMDEDVLQALLSHFIGNKWCVFVKETLQTVIQETGVWTKGTTIPDGDQALRRYYLDESVSSWATKHAVEKRRHEIYNENFFLAPMPSGEFEDAVGYDDADDNSNGDDDQSMNTKNSDKLSPKEVKQLLLRTLATEVLIGKVIDGEVAVIQSDFQWFATGLAHSTVFAVLRFVGFPDEWIRFFKGFLEPPLDMLTGGPVRTRKRGLPMAHIFEKLFGELVLFFMDIAVNRQANMLLYRFHDDLWLCGKPTSCAKAWKTMRGFADVMGLEFNKSKTGSVYLAESGRIKCPEVIKTLPQGPVTVNFLVLDPVTGDWVINEDHVKQHVTQLHKQLKAATSVLQWVKTWNSCIGRFFSYTFGDPANCFGRKHLNAILSTHQFIQKFLFDGQNGNGNSVTEHLKAMISSRFNVTDIPDAFLYMPEALGGLGLHNPFVPLLLVSPNICEDPEQLIRDFLRKEKKAYREAKRQFDNLSEHERRRRFREVFPKDEETGLHLFAPSSENAKVFFSFEQFSRWRECTSLPFSIVFSKLNLAAPMEKMALSHKVQRELKSLSSHPSNLKELNPSIVDPEVGWLIEFYSAELVAKCGGLSIVDRSFLPLGVLKAMRKKKVAWQMAL